MKKTQDSARLYIRVPKPHHDKLLRTAGANKVSLQELMAALVADFVHGSPGPYTAALFDSRAKKPLPPIIRGPGRKTCTFVRWTSERYDAINAYVPKEWYDYFEKLSEEKGRSADWLIAKALGQYLTREEIAQRAAAKGVPLNCEKRELLMHVFPDLPLCDFSQIVRRRAVTTPKLKAA